MADLVAGSSLQDALSRALALEGLAVAEAERRAGELWREHRPALLACVEGEQRRRLHSATVAAVGLLGALAARGGVARALLQDLERGGARIERGLRSLELPGGAPQQVGAPSPRVR